MRQNHSIRYLFHQNSGIELVICENCDLSFPLHNHVSVFTLGMVLNGSIKMMLNGQQVHLKENSIFTISPYVPHSIEAISTYALLSICIPKHILYNLNYDIFRKNIMIILSEAFINGKANLEQIFLILNNLDCCQKNSNQSPGKTNPSIEFVKEQLELYPETNFCIDKMAQTANISKYHFIRRFKQEVGLTPHQFQIQNRIRKAQRLLNEIPTITEVALTTGFCDQSHFIKQFEKIVGLTPTSYKTAFNIIKPKC